VLENGCHLVTIKVAAATYPIVMAQIGNYTGPTTGKQHLPFQPGNIWTSHSSKTERVTYEAMRKPAMPSCQLPDQVCAIVDLYTLHGMMGLRVICTL
jgi:hypothetical protein